MNCNLGIAVMETQKICEEFSSPPSKLLEDIIKQQTVQSDGQMTSSILSASSSLTSPGDSGVQLLDSESEITSLMSMSGIGCDFETTANNLNNEEIIKNIILGSSKKIPNFNVVDDGTKGVLGEERGVKKACLEQKERPKVHIMTKSDIDNHNTHLMNSPAILSVSLTTNSLVPFEDRQHINKKYIQQAKIQKIEKQELLELDPVLNNDECKKSENLDDLMNVSLTSYELLDYTSENVKPLFPNVSVNEMHVSMSEEVNESLKVDPPPVEPEKLPTPLADDQIVFRRQRRKKSKSDTPKKRVSFHEDILNSTKIDDIHINHGFITHEPDISMSFFERGFIRKPDVVKGRYSWAAEGDTPYYQKNQTEREVKSDIYIHRARFSSSSSSSSITSSIDEEDTGNSNSDDCFIKKEPTTEKLPKSSCLKKSKSSKKYIDTNIVEEGLKKKKSETNLLDSNIFGSLKNMFSFSTSVPLAERGVPEGQEDITVYSTSDVRVKNISQLPVDGYEIKSLPIKKNGNLNLELTKTNLKLTKSEGFFPNYANNQNLPNNIIVCDSNVYEHKGISYSYEYEKFQKTFQQNKPKSSTIYQTLLKELNFFKRKEKKALEKDVKDSFEIIDVTTPVKNIKPEEDFQEKKYQSSVTVDFSDTETNWSFNEGTHTRHLNSPKHKAKPHRYSLQSTKSDSEDLELVMSAKLLESMKPASSKTSLINRFLRNVTMKKMMDLKLQNKLKYNRKYISLYVKGVKPNVEMSRRTDEEIQKEIHQAQDRKSNVSGIECGTHLVYRFKNEIFVDFTETVLGVFPVYSAYTTTGENKPLMVILSNTTMYITGFKPNNSYINHFVLSYTELNTILIGPNAQTIHISNHENDKQCIIATGSENVTNELIGCLEMAMRRDTNKPKLLAVKQLTMQDMMNLRRAICKQTTVTKDEEYFHYSIVNIQDYNSDSWETPLGPSKEGPLMFKTNESDTRWETAYFILKAGILYMLSSPSHRLPMRVLPLINGACQGAQRVFNCTRPHTFQLQVGATTLHLAAPDEYVASEWLQALVHAASKTYNHREKMPTQSCSLLMTNQHILTVREAFPCTLSDSLGLREQHQPIKGVQPLSCAAIADITAFKLPCAEQSWCILEFACREVHESSGDWIVYFSTNTELEKFISTLEMLWDYHNQQGDSFPLSTIPETSTISRKCSDTYSMIQNTWLSLQMELKSF